MAGSGRAARSTPHPAPQLAARSVRALKAGKSPSPKAVKVSRTAIRDSQKPSCSSGTRTAPDRLTRAANNPAIRDRATPKEIRERWLRTMAAAIGMATQIASGPAIPPVIDTAVSEARVQPQTNIRRVRGVSRLRSATAQIPGSAMTTTAASTKSDAGRNNRPTSPSNRQADHPRCQAITAGPTPPPSGRNALESFEK